jgi:hypothetical protein
LNGEEEAVVGGFGAACVRCACGVDLALGEDLEVEFRRAPGPACMVGELAAALASRVTLGAPPDDSRVEPCIPLCEKPPGGGVRRSIELGNACEVARGSEVVGREGIDGGRDEEAFSFFGLSTSSFVAFALGWKWFKWALRLCSQANGSGGNIQGTSREHLGNIQGLAARHSSQPVKRSRSTHEAIPQA